MTVRRSYLPREERVEVETLTRRLVAEHLGERIQPLIKWTYSRSYMGLAFTSILCYRDPRISYSAPLMTWTTREDRVETVYHEVSHLLVWYEIFDRYPADGSKGSPWDEYNADGEHGPLFMAQMAKFGYPNPKGCSR